MRARVPHHSGQNLKRTSLRAFFSTMSLAAGESAAVDMVLVRSLLYSMVGWGAVRVRVVARTPVDGLC